MPKSVPIPRRTLLGGAAAGLATVVGIEAATAADLPSGFPPGTSLYREVFRNWDGVVTTAPLWTCAPASSAALLDIVNWARTAGWRLRPRGFRHSWSPLTVADDATDQQTLLIDTTRRLTAMQMEGDNVRVQAGARMDTLFDFLHRQGRSLLAAPAPGDVSVGGVLAVGGHGSAIPAKDEAHGPGRSFGTMSNQVLEFRVIAWRDTTGQYAEQTISRSDPEAGALLTHLGRAFVTEVLLQTVPDYNLRCQSYTDIRTSELFADPSNVTSRSLTSLLDQAGRVGVIWYTFTDHPWVQVWTPAPTRPFWSRPTTGPYNFAFADNLPNPVPQLAGQLIAGMSWVAPAFGNAVLAATATGLTATLARDLWGPAKNAINFVKPTTLRVSAGSQAVVCRRADVQRVVHEFTEAFKARLSAYQARREFPVNSCVEIRITGIDDPADVATPGARVAELSPARPVDDRPDLDTVVWLDILTMPGTPHEFEFYAETEQFIRNNYASYAVVRPEWSKRWATTAAGAWTDDAAMRGPIPAAFPQWDSAWASLDRLDPHGVFSSALTTRLRG
ncbi:cholesterol oxidase substrate-binding domain-containing protein [Flexivirga meconopsidis]|uniref:cholesterol oxidase substrate-binding domain-containing protein n=1 Tax=Flexivirga meconopsidis TaxID=2977121 RepID=UPI0022405871|nr:cholesterol oxidase substrate-binding domain-containing protein [Flexivirga meconopsidis]